jgi:hypothetical protein
VRLKTNREKSLVRLWYHGSFMLIRDNKFDEFTLPDKISKINMTHAWHMLISTSFGQCLEMNQRESVHVWRKIEHVRAPQTMQCIPYELLLYLLNTINVCAIKRPPNTTDVFKFLAHKGNKEGPKSIMVPKITRQPLHKSKHC